MSWAPAPRERQKARSPWVLCEPRNQPRVDPLRVGRGKASRALLPTWPPSFGSRISTLTRKKCQGRVCGSNHFSLSKSLSPPLALSLPTPHPPGHSPSTLAAGGAHPTWSRSGTLCPPGRDTAWGQTRPEKAGGLAGTCTLACGSPGKHSVHLHPWLHLKNVSFQLPLCGNLGAPCRLHPAPPPRVPG